ncbi:MAG: hypothetical protein WCO06_04415, partial [Candidatus Roizmanbacteria bacterium]
MRKNISVYIISLIALSGFSGSVYAQKISSPSASVEKQIISISPTPVEAKEIQDLKERIATKVAELRRKSPKGISGLVVEIKSNSTYRVKASDDNIYDVKVDDTYAKIYQVAVPQKKELKFNDVKKNDYVIVTGPLLDKTINANYVYVDEQFKVDSGKIVTVNKTDFSIDIVTSEKNTITLDI